MKASTVTLEVYLPASVDNMPATAIIVCPGGSYSWLDIDTEGVKVAEHLRSKGIAAFVLKYRVQGKFQFASHSRAIFGGNKHPDAICDLQRAIQYVREHDKEYGINKNKVGVMGFSAGGHLVMSAAEFFNTNFLSNQGIITDTSLKPDFVAPIYPVVSMSHESAHTRSRRALLGEWKKFSKEMRDSLSLENHVPDDCPPVFLLNCKDDPVVDYRNSMLLDSALTAHNISHLYIQYPTGGHGFGAERKKMNEYTKNWLDRFTEWLKRENF